MSFVIDISQLPALEAIKSLNYDAIKAERLADLVARLTAIGIDFDVDGLETDPAVVLQELDGYREYQDKGAINDAVRDVMPAYARGANLEGIAARVNIQREIVTPADPVTGAAAVMETDADLLKRYLAGYSAPSAGSEEAYYGLAAKAYPGRGDIKVLDWTVHGRPGRIEIVLLAKAGEAVPAEAVNAVRLAMSRKGVRPASDEVVVRTGTVVPWSLRGTLMVPDGPDPTKIVALAKVAAWAWGLGCYQLGGQVPANGASSALFVPNVLRADLASPLVDIPPRVDAAPWLTAVDLDYVVLK